MTTRDITRPLDAVIFNIAVGNLDSHAKNHVQGIGGQRRRVRHFDGRNWRRMAEAAGLAGPATIRRVRAVTDRLLVALPGTVEAAAGMLDAGTEQVRRFASSIADRATVVRDHAAIEGPPEPDAPPEPATTVSRYDA